MVWGEKSPRIADGSTLPWWSLRRWRDGTSRTSPRHVHLFEPPISTEPPIELSGPWPRPETWLDVRVGTYNAIVREQEEVSIGDYTIFVERSGRDESYRDECVAIVRSAECLREPAIASAKRLLENGVRTLGWPSEPFTNPVFAVLKNGLMCSVELHYTDDHAECLYVRDGEIVARERFICHEDAAHSILKNAPHSLQKIR